MNGDREAERKPKVLTGLGCASCGGTLDVQEGFNLLAIESCRFGKRFLFHLKFGYFCSHSSQRSLF